MCISTYIWIKKKKNKIRRTINHLTDDDIFDCMAELPVAKLMTEDCKDLWVVASLLLVL